MKGRLSFVLIASAAFVLILYGIDQWLQVNYLLKSTVKIGLLAGILVIYKVRLGGDVIGSSVRNFRTGPNPRYPVLIGLALILLIPALFLVLRGAVDEGQMLLDFEEKYKITKNNFIYYGLYLSVFNAMLEEVFFRGFLFLEILKMNRRGMAYLVSAFFFAIYHLANISGWFTPAIFILTLSGLMIGGLLFNYLDEKKKTFLNSYFVHFCADIGIVAAGWILFTGS
jgi:membrane protease YdiL (CAAX protease family)